MGRDKRERMDVNVTGIEELRNGQAKMLGGLSAWRVGGARLERSPQRTRCQSPW